MKRESGDRGTALATRCQTGDRAACEQLCEQFREPLYRLAFRFAGDRDPAEDLTQEILLRMLQKLHTFRGDSAFETWLYRLAVNVCLNRPARPCQNLDALESEPADPGPGPAEQYEGLELSREVAAALSQLPGSSRSVFILVVQEGCSYSEAANMLDINVEAVRMRMSRARRELRKRLADQGFTSARS